jgi:GNAT superfamily N-acetyltransferase
MDGCPRQNPAYRLAEGKPPQMWGLSYARMRLDMPSHEASLAPFDRIHLPAVMALFAAEGWSYADDAERTWRALTAPGSKAIVALADNDVVGVAHALSDGEIQAFLAILVVAAAHRRRGVGERLVREVFARTEAERMDLVSCDDAFYEKLGFRQMSAFRTSRDELGQGSRGGRRGR